MHSESPQQASQASEAAPAELLHHIIQYQSAQRPSAAALWWEGRSSTFAALQDATLRIAGRLATTGNAGDRIAVLGWNSPAFLQLIYGASAAGKVLVPLNARLAPKELAYQLRASGASLTHCEPARQPVLCASVATSVPRSGRSWSRRWCSAPGLWSLWRESSDRSRKKRRR